MSKWRREYLCEVFSKDGASLTVDILDEAAKQCLDSVGTVSEACPFCQEPCEKPWCPYTEKE